MAAITLQQLYSKLLQTLESSADVRFILQHRLKVRAEDVILNPDRMIAPEEAAVCFEDTAACAGGQPLSRRYGLGHFFGLDFALSPDTLDPRPDSEALILCAQAYFAEKAPPKAILDLGTGTGCLLITLLTLWPEARGVGVDLSAGALVTARDNATKHNVHNRAAFIEGDWLSGVEAEFDLVISNPPYIARAVIPGLEASVRAYDPILALDGGEDGLEAYRKIFSGIFRVLRPGGIGLFEIGYDQAESVTRLSKDYGLYVRGVHLDLAGRPRVVEICCGDK